MKFHRSGLWALVVFVLVLVFAAAKTSVAVGAAIATGVILELLTWRGVFGRRRKTEKSVLNP